MTSRFHLAVCLAASFLLAACGSGKDDSEVDVAFIGSSGELFEDGQRLAPAGQQIRSATAEGLVSLNQAGEVVPALAERWIVTEDGLSYIFRLRNAEWADGTALTSNSVRDALRRNIRGVARDIAGSRPGQDRRNSRDDGQSGRSAPGKPDARIPAIAGSAGTRPEA